MSTDRRTDRAGPTASELARGKSAVAWVDLSPLLVDAAPRQRSSAVLPAKTDVVIVGSGFTGLSAALTLLRNGRSVVVLDEE